MSTKITGKIVTKIGRSIPDYPITHTHTHTHTSHTQKIAGTWLGRSSAPLYRLHVTLWCVINVIIVSYIIS